MRKFLARVARRTLRERVPAPRKFTLQRVRSSQELQHGTGDAAKGMVDILEGFPVK